MRVEPHSVGSIVHVLKRGGRGMEIVRDESDCRRFERSLFYLNDSKATDQWAHDTSALVPPERPRSWGKRDPLTHVLAWTLLPDHFHLLLQETQEGGIAKYMQRVCGSMTKSFNAKYGGRGSIFQSSYKGRVVETDAYLRWLVPYILVKNTFEMYPRGGLEKTVKKFDAAWKWGLAFPHSSFRTFACGEHSPITEDVRGRSSAKTCESADASVRGMYGSAIIFKKEARDMLIANTESLNEDLSHLMMERW